MVEERKVYMVLMGKPKGKRAPRNLGVDERMGSEWILGDWLGRRSSSLRIETGGGLL
jgi:hypothetical protein